MLTNNIVISPGDSLSTLWVDIIIVILRNGDDTIAFCETYLHGSNLSFFLHIAVDLNIAK